MIIQFQVYSIVFDDNNKSSYFLAIFQDSQQQDKRRFSNVNLTKQSADSENMKLMNRSKSQIQQKKLKNNVSYTQLHRDKPSNKENMYTAAAVNMINNSGNSSILGINQQHLFRDNIFALPSSNSYTNSYYQQHLVRKVKQNTAARIIQKWYRNLLFRNSLLRNRKRISKSPWICNRSLNNKANTRLLLQKSKSHFGN